MLLVDVERELNILRKVLQELLEISYALIERLTKWIGLCCFLRSVIHELCPTNHHSSLEHATYGTSYLSLASLNLTTCHLSNPRSINLI